MVLNRRSVIALAGGGAVMLSGCATTGGTASNAASGSRGRSVRRAALPADYFTATPAPFPQFSSVPEVPTHGFNFDSWNKLIANYVIDFGPSDRVSRGKPAAAIGTRFVNGHESQYRAEGNRIPFSLFEDEDRRRFSQARQVLEDLGNNAPISQFSWSDQLAYWFNLHNAALIEQLALRYPVQRPERMLVGPDRLPLHEAKLVTVKDTPLSLRDIRVEIVYRHWRHPAAIYGFFHGVVGGPSIRKGAFRGSRIRRQLADSANEFVNSLRGVRDFKSHIGVSTLYNETLPLFPNWQIDLRNHLASFADTEVSQLLEGELPLRIKQYDSRIADLAGGERDTTSSSRTPSTGIAPSDITGDASDALGNQMITAYTRPSSSSIPGLPDHGNRMMRERRNKFQTLQSRFGRRRKGIVTITDLPTQPVE